MGDHRVAKVEKTTSIHEYLAENVWLSLTQYCAVPPQTIHFWFEKIVKSLQLCVSLDLQLLGCNVLDQGPLQT